MNISQKGGEIFPKKVGRTKGEKAKGIRLAQTTPRRESESKLFQQRGDVVV